MRLRMMLVVAASLLAGCAGGITESSNPVVGAYALDRVNNVSLPYLAEQSGSTRLEIVSGSLVIRDDGTYAAAIVSRLSDGTQSSTLEDQSAGTFSVTSQGVSFVEAQGAETYTGIVTGSRLTATRKGVTFGFLRE